MRSKFFNNITGGALFLLASFTLVVEANAQAFRTNQGFTANTLARNDDDSTLAVPIGFTINFFGSVQNTLFVNNNGNVTFTGPLATFTPFPLQNTETKIIAPFFGDVDTSNTLSGVVQYGMDTVGGRSAFGVNWPGVGYYDTNADRLNTFQLVLIDRSDTGAGNFDFEFNYTSIQWETGDASGGIGGLGGSSARVGYSNGTNNSFELPGSAVNGAFLNGGPRALTSLSIGTTVVGRAVFQVRNGMIQPPPAIISPLAETTTVNQPFVYQFATTGATSLAVSNLPPGLFFDSKLAVITGTPTATGTSQIRLSASDAVTTTTETLTLTVQAAPTAGPVIISGTSATGRTGVRFNFQVITTGATAAARLSATGLPPGLTVDSITGIISGTPTTDGSFGVGLTVTEGSFTTRATLQLTFSSNLALPVITSSNSALLTPGQAFFYQIVAPVVGPTDTTFFQLDGNLPPGLGFDSGAGTISGTFNPLSNAREGEVPELSGGVITNVQLFATNSEGTTTIPFNFFQTPLGAANISTRAAVGTGDNVLIVGYIITGNAPKKVILRAIAPSLNVNGVPVPGTLADPILTLNGTGLNETNDDWRSSQEQEIIDTGVPPTDNRESAIIAILNPGNYTAIMSGKAGATGVGLVEVFDLGTASFDSSSNSKLANLSTRGFVQTGDNVLIGGFIIRGGTSNLIVRAIGPALTDRGVAGALADTTLELFNANGMIASNDDWRSTQEQQIIATTVPPTDNRESAIVASLVPGNYTAIVRGKNGSTGVGLVEVYVLN